MDQWGIEPAPLRFFVLPYRKRFRKEGLKLTNPTSAGFR